MDWIFFNVYYIPIFLHLLYVFRLSVTCLFFVNISFQSSNLKNYFSFKTYDVIYLYFTSFVRFFNIFIRPYMCLPFDQSGTYYVSIYRFKKTHIFLLKDISYTYISQHLYAFPFFFLDSLFWLQRVQTIWVLYIICIFKGMIPYICLSVFP